MPVDTHVSTPEIFYGIDGIRVDVPASQNSLSLIPLRLGRLSLSNVEIGEHTLGPPSESVFLPNMRSFSIAKNGRYKLTFPGEASSDARSIRRSGPDSVAAPPCQHE